MTTQTNVGVRGKVLDRQAREIVANVIKFMQEEAKEGAKIPLSKFKERVLAATKIGEFSYRKIKKEAQEISMGKKLGFSCPKKNTNRPSPKSNLNTGQQECIRRIIHDYYILEKRLPTLKGIHMKVLESGIDFQGGLTTLAKVIRKLGFRWCKTADKRRILVESYDLRLKRYKTKIKSSTRRTI